MVFRHRKCFGRYQVLIGSPKGVPGTPDKRLGLMGQEGKCTSHKELVCPPICSSLRGEGKRGRERKEWNMIPPSSPLFPSPPTNMARGAAKGRSPSRIRSYLGRPLASPLSLPPIYMWEGHLAHPRQLLSRVRRPPPSFTPPDIFS